MRRFGWLVLAASAWAEQPVTTESLLRETADLERLTRPAAYTCRQFSSYDRLCAKGDPFANDDSGNYLRRDGDEYVLAEAEGPGAIVRIWSANPEGTLKIRLDGRVEVEADFKDLLAGKVEPFREPYAGFRARGGNLYFPIPYAKSMQVTCSKGGQYYHVNVRTWPAGTKVETFSKRKLGDKARELAAALTGDPTRVPRDAITRTAGEEIPGPGTILRLDVDARGDRLRECLLKITIDGEPAVCCPVPDFFGVAPDPAHLETLPMTASGKGTLRCRFPMPFEKSAKVEIDAGGTGAKVEARALVAPGACGPLRFHAWWRGSNALRTRPMSDWPVARLRGRGRYVGTTLAVRNPVRAWWGEGDEKVRVDGEAFPSTFGTGTEDYFGYAWCDTALFSAPFHAQSRCDGPGNRGQTAVCRWHVLDDIPFEKSLDFDLEVWHWAECEIGYSTVAYWYAEPGGAHGFEPGKREDMRVVALAPAAGVKGAQEGEKLKVVKCSGGEARPQDMTQFGGGWSGDEQLWWTGAKVGDELWVEFESAGEGRGRIAVALTRAPDYGVVRVAVNGVEVEGEVDLYGEAVGRVEEREYEVEMKRGRNVLELRVTGTNEKATPAGYMVGLDYVRVVEE